MGLYGFGLKELPQTWCRDYGHYFPKLQGVSPSKSKLQIIRKQKEKGVTYQEFLHDNTTKKMFNGGYRVRELLLEISIPP